MVAADKPTVRRDCGRGQANEDPADVSARVERETMPSPECQLYLLVNGAQGFCENNCGQGI